MKQMRHIYLLLLPVFMFGCHENREDGPMTHQVIYFLGYSMATVLPLVVIAVVIYWILRVRDKSKEI